jgi:RNA polymerase sigma-70 factor (ECF subfamily)
MCNEEWQLVENAKSGDTHAFARLYEKYYQDLYRFALCQVKNTQMAEDVVSQAVLKAYEKLPQLRKSSSFKSWLFQITVNECHLAFRRQESFLEDAGYEEPQACEEGFQKMELLELLGELSEPERLVVALSVFGGYNSREISQLVKKKEGSVRSLKSRALTKLRTCMDK